MLPNSQIVQHESGSFVANNRLEGSRAGLKIYGDRLIYLNPVFLARKPLARTFMFNMSSAGKIAQKESSFELLHRMIHLSNLVPQEPTYSEKSLPIISSLEPSSNESIPKRIAVEVGTRGEGSHDHFEDLTISENSLKDCILSRPNMHVEKR